ncbi:MAG: hypothetical protein B6229_00760 [Spirochaetaceae bacterium 4572_7]|nr:MAG: hypothetical protein B6229_00760 [Spirochaetaceae bacterium 4572_7]
MSDFSDETVYKRSSSAKKKGKELKGKLQLSWKGKSLPIKKVIKIGRDKSNNVVLDDPLVSRKHAVIEKVGDIFYIRDLESTNSTYVNKNPLKPGEVRKLQPGSVINIGKCEFQIT